MPHHCMTLLRITWDHRSITNAVRDCLWWLTTPGSVEERVELDADQLKQA